MAGPFRDTALCCPSEPWGQPSAIGESPLPLPKQTSSPSSPVGHGGCSQFYCLLWLAAKCKQELQLTWTGKRCGFSCSKGIWWLITTIQSGQAQPHPPRTALVRGQVVKTWAFVSWNNVVGVRRPFLTLSLSGSTMDTHLHDVADIIQESWSEVLEGAAGARQTHGVTSRDLAFSNQVCSFFGERYRASPNLRNGDKDCHGYVPWQRKQVHKVTLTQKAISICSQGKLPHLWQELCWLSSLNRREDGSEVRMGAGQKLKEC